MYSVIASSISFYLFDIIIGVLVLFGTVSSVKTGCATLLGRETSALKVCSNLMAKEQSLRFKLTG